VWTIRQADARARAIGECELTVEFWKKPVPWTTGAVSDSV